MTIQWIPVTERLPEMQSLADIGLDYSTSGRLLVSYKVDFGGLPVDPEREFVTGCGKYEIIQGVGDWTTDSPNRVTLTAWAPLPEPYRGK